MLIRFKWWATDGVPAHKAVRGAVEYVFLDTNHGLCDVRDRKGVEYLLARPANYELAYDHLTPPVMFDADGQQVAVGPPVGSAVGPAVGSAEPTPAEIPSRHQEPPSKRKPGRPRRG